MERAVRQRLDNSRGLLTKHTADGRELLRRLLVGPIRFTPDGRRYQFEGKAAIGRLLTGLIDVRTFVASPEGSDVLQTLIDRWSAA